MSKKLIPATRLLCPACGYEMAPIFRGRDNEHRGLCGRCGLETPDYYLGYYPDETAEERGKFRSPWGPSRSRT